MNFSCSLIFGSIQSSLIKPCLLTAAFFLSRVAVWRWPQSASKCTSWRHRPPTNSSVEPTYVKPSYWLPPLLTTLWVDLTVTSVFETQSKKLKVLMAWISNHSQKSWRPSWLESQIINIKLKINQQKVPGPPKKLSAQTGGPVGIFNTEWHHLGQITKVWLSCYLVLLSTDSKTR